MNVLDLFAFHVSAVELMLRGSIMFWFLFLAFRFVLRRDGGGLGIADVLFIVIVADAAQNAMAGASNTVAEGMVLVGTLIGWNYLLDWASFRWAVVRRFTASRPLLLIDEGRLVAKNLRKEFLTRDDVEAQLRQNGVENVADVRKAFMESDGKFSVLTYDGEPHRDKQHGAPGT